MFSLNFWIVDFRWFYTHAWRLAVRNKTFFQQFAICIKRNTKNTENCIISYKTVERTAAKMVLYFRKL